MKTVAEMNAAVLFMKTIEQLEEPADRIVAADMLLDAGGSEYHAGLLRDPEAPCVLVAGLWVHRLCLGNGRWGRFDVLVGDDPITVSHWQLRRGEVMHSMAHPTRRKLRKRLFDFLQSRQWNFYCERQPPKRQTAKTHMSRFDVNNGFVYVATPAERRLLGL